MAEAIEKAVEMHQSGTDHAHELRGKDTQQPVDQIAVDIKPSQEQEKKEDHGGYMRIFTFAGTMEYVIFGVSILAAIASGAGIALQNLVFGKFVTVLTDFSSGKSSGADMRAHSSELAYASLHLLSTWRSQLICGRLYLVYIGIGRFVLSYTYNSLLTYNAYRIVRNIRLTYLRAALRQEVAFFDLGTGGSIAT
ncbi:hypothetical protein QQS21_006365 [Conoideocrella luteorostrata]|uniref:ABC transmembrane type-1 domain-containing protein n=1 Tax=Conoideocrella luteorostrata TaxID=1105319 RepID=A0AAJ0FY26_9HYPO|nr:hypothetical protein QQS21_006365 [Conoideocrella luteorostrata]